MPTRKQRRRRQKDRRHEWEYVYVDDEGREVEVEEDEAPTKAAKPAKQPAKASARPAAKGAARAPGRKIDPPSWQKVFRRAAIFTPIMLIVVYLLKPKDATALSIVVQVVVLLLFFIPFSYFMDVMMYRNYRKRIGDPIPPRQRKR
jgi:ABC-type Na+ efflux pump permease subunit